jgi:hypothetical protein
MCDGDSGTTNYSQRTPRKVLRRLEHDPPSALAWVPLRPLTTARMAAAWAAARRAAEAIRIQRQAPKPTDAGRAGHPCIRLKIGQHLRDRARGPVLEMAPAVDLDAGALLEVLIEDRLAGRALALAGYRGESAILH